MKRGEVAVSVIIVIALGLLVLILLATLVGRSIIDANEQFKACEDTYGGTCMVRSECIDNGGRINNGPKCEAGATSTYGSWVMFSFPTGGTGCCIGAN